MEITDEHRARATRLATAPHPATGLLDAPVAAGYLAAVERIEDAGERPDVCNDEYDVAAYVPEELVWIEANGGHIRASAARELAYELLVLADLAEGESDA